MNFFRQRNSAEDIPAAVPDKPDSDKATIGEPSSSKHQNRSLAAASLRLLHRIFSKFSLASLDPVVERLS